MWSGTCHSWAARPLVVDAQTTADRQYPLRHASILRDLSSLSAHRTLLRLWARKHRSSLRLDLALPLHLTTTGPQCQARTPWQSRRTLVATLSSTANSTMAEQQRAFVRQPLRWPSCPTMTTCRLRFSDSLGSSRPRFQASTRCLQRTRPRPCPKTASPTALLLVAATLIAAVVAMPVRPMLPMMPPAGLLVGVVVAAVAPHVDAVVHLGVQRLLVPLLHLQPPLPPPLSPPPPLLLRLPLLSNQDGIQYVCQHISHIVV